MAVHRKHGDFDIKFTNFELHDMNKSDYVSQTKLIITIIKCQGKKSALKFSKDEKPDVAHLDLRCTTVRIQILF